MGAEGPPEPAQPAAEANTGSSRKRKGLQEVLGANSDLIKRLNAAQLCSTEALPGPEEQRLLQDATLNLIHAALALKPQDLVPTAAAREALWTAIHNMGLLPAADDVVPPAPAWMTQPDWLEKLDPATLSGALTYLSLLKPVLPTILDSKTPGDSLKAALAKITFQQQPQLGPGGQRQQVAGVGQRLPSVAGGSLYQTPPGAGALAYQRPQANPAAPLMQQAWQYPARGPPQQQPPLAPQQRIPHAVVPGVARPPRLQAGAQLRPPVLLPGMPLAPGAAAAAAGDKELAALQQTLSVLQRMQAVAMMSTGGVPGAPLTQAAAKQLQKDPQHQQLMNYASQLLQQARMAGKGQQAQLLLAQCNLGIPAHVLQQAPGSCGGQVEAFA